MSINYLNSTTVIFFIKTSLVALYSKLLNFHFVHLTANGFPFLENNSHTKIALNSFLFLKLKKKEYMEIKKTKSTKTPPKKGFQPSKNLVDDTKRVSRGVEIFGGERKKIVFRGVEMDHGIVWS